MKPVKVLTRTFCSSFLRYTVNEAMSFLRAEILQSRLWGSRVHETGKSPHPNLFFYFLEIFGE